MSYLPPTDIGQTVFPRVGKDVDLANQLLIEKWKRFYPILNYYPLKVTPTTPQDDMITGVEGETLVDDLWGEDVFSPGDFWDAPDNQEWDHDDLWDSTGGWVQPHSTEDSPNPDGSIDDSRVYGTLIQVNTYLNKQPTEQMLKKMGIDMKKDLLVVWPLALLDQVGFYISIGDKFIWKGDTYEIEYAKLTGYWKMTNYAMYMSAMATKRRSGS